MSTISDVAKLAGVSPKTVSRVLNAEPNVTDSTRTAVLEAISKLNYFPNQSARQMRTRQSNIIGLISDEIATTPYAVDIIKGAQAAAWSFGKLLTVINTENDVSVEKRAFQLAREYRFDAVIYAAYFHREVHLTEHVGDIPLVLVDCFEARGSLPSVVPNEIQGAFDATAELIKNRHRRIGFINYDQPIPATLGRLEGYRRALETAGIAFDPELVIADNGQANGGYRAALKLLKRRDRPTALFCWNDRVAMGVYDAVRHLNLSIPDDVAIVGFDNQEIIASQLHPALTTIQLPHYEMGQWAIHHVVETTLDERNGSQHTPVQHKIDCRLVQRASV
jgi:LacI family transcriptional regulator